MDESLEVSEMRSFTVQRSLDPWSTTSALGLVPAPAKNCVTAGARPSPIGSSARWMIRARGAKGKAPRARAGGDVSRCEGAPGGRGDTRPGGRRCRRWAEPRENRRRAQLHGDSTLQGALGRFNARSPESASSLIDRRI